MIASLAETARMIGTGLGGSAPAEYLTPFQARASYRNGAPSAVLVLQQKPSASVDYYLRPRLEAESGLEWATADLSTSPEMTPLLRRHGVWVVICRYINAPWLDALAAVTDHLSGVSFFVDDDLAAMMSETGVPLEARLKVMRLYGRHRPRLEALTSEVWASTEALAEQAGLKARILPPKPFDAPAAPSLGVATLAVYHGTLTHRPERAFLRRLAQRLEADGGNLRLEVAGGVTSGLSWLGLRKVKVTPQRSWSRYLQRQRTRQAAFLLAPLQPTRINHARAAVKRFDAARLGAVGVYADVEPYRSAVRDGVDGLLLPMNVDAWARALTELAADPQRRLRLAMAARERILAEQAAIAPLFPERPGC